MSTRFPYTPNSKIKAALRQLWLRSRERQSALKRDHYTCQGCKAKQSRAKGKEVYVEVHHREGVTNWQELYAAVRRFLLCPAEDLVTLCETCHKEMTMYEKPAADDQEDFVPCQVCDGKGWIANKDGTGEACEFCGGTGNAKHSDG